MKKYAPSLSRNGSSEAEADALRFRFAEGKAGKYKCVIEKLLHSIPATFAYRV